MKNPVLYIFSGLPATGKTTLAQQLARHMGAAYFRIDTIEQGLRDLCSFNVCGEGYHLTYRIALDNLSLGMSVVADSCNPIGMTRDEWHEVAINAGARFVDIEIICSDKEEHRKRIETRSGEIRNLMLPTWSEVIGREYHEWIKERVVIDTSGISEVEAFDLLISELNTFVWSILPAGLQD